MYCLRGLSGKNTPLRKEEPRHRICCRENASSKNAPWVVTQNTTGLNLLKVLNFNDIVTLTNHFKPSLTLTEKGPKVFYQNEDILAVDQKVWLPRNESPTLPGCHFSAASRACSFDQTLMWYMTSGWSNCYFLHSDLNLIWSPASRSCGRRKPTWLSQQLKPQKETMQQRWLPKGIRLHS